MSAALRNFLLTVLATVAATLAAQTLINRSPTLRRIVGGF